MNNQSNIVFLNSYNNITNIFNEALKIYNIYNDFYVDNENQKMNYISNLSDEILSSSNSSIKSDNNKYNEYSSFHENPFSFKSWKIKGLNINENEYKKINFKKDNIIAIDLSYMFYGCSSLLSITGLSKINTSNV